MSMVITAVDGKIEQYEKSMPKNYWLRNKKQSINLLHDTPFAMERQLEDQRLMAMKNRNPQALIPTKADKVRSENIIAKKGASRGIAVKANVLNKIIREASDVYNYTLVAPPRSKTGGDALEKIAPEMNPKLASYARETKFKPVIRSFGHRPRSASRTFHPATMRFKLKHGEIMKKEDESRVGFGLSVAVLSQVLSAPPVPRPGDDLKELEEQERAAKEKEMLNQSGGVYSDSNRERQEDIHNLFLSEDDQNQLFSNTKLHHRGNKLGGGDKSVQSWVSSAAEEKALKQKEKVEARKNEKPDWDKTIIQAISKSQWMKMTKDKPVLLPLQERLTRFNALSVGVTVMGPVCSEKQETDRYTMQHQGVPPPVPKSTPLPNRPLFYDPCDQAVRLLQKDRREEVKEIEAKKKAFDYQMQLKSLPVENYFPTSVHAKNLAKGGGSVRSTSGPLSPLSSSALSKSVTASTSLKRSNSFKAKAKARKNKGNISAGSNRSYTDEPDAFGENTGSHSHSVSFESTVTGGEDDGYEGGNERSTVASSRERGGDHHTNVGEEEKEEEEDWRASCWASQEEDFKNAMAAARRGDTRALYNYNMKLSREQTPPIEQEEEEQQMGHHLDETEFGEDFKDFYATSSSGDESGAQKEQGQSEESGNDGVTNQKSNTEDQYQDQEGGQEEDD